MYIVSPRVLSPIKREDIFAGMAELADALDSGSSGGNSVQVQVLLPAPPSENPYYKRFSGVFLYGIPIYWRVKEFL